MMKGWKKVRLGDFANITMGQSPPSKDYNNEGHGLPFYQGKSEFGEYYPSIAQYSVSGNKKAEKGDILFTVRAPVGELNFSNCHCIIGRGLASIRAKENKHQRFLYYLLKVSRTAFESRSYGAVYDAINAKDLKNSELLIPKDGSSIDKIASILSAYDDLIENNLKRIKLLEEKAQLTYEEWFVRMKFPGHETTPINKETGLPEGWDKKKIGDVIDYRVDNRGRNPKYYCEKGIPVLDNHLVNNSPYVDLGKAKRYLDEELFDNFLRKYLNVGDVLITLVGTVANIALAPKEKCAIIQNTIGLRCNELCNPYFLFLFLKVNKVAILNCNRGSAQPSVKVGDLLSIKMNYPGSRLVEKFGNYCSPIFDEIINLGKQNQLLREARNILLPRLMTGMIDVEKMNLENLQPTTA